MTKRCQISHQNAKQLLRKKNNFRANYIAPHAVDQTQSHSVDCTATSSLPTQ